MQWIANTIGKLMTDKLGPPCVMELTQDNVRLDVLEYQLPCGHPAFGVFLAYREEDGEPWVPIAALRDFQVDAAIALLKEAQRCVHTLSE